MTARLTTRWNAAAVAIICVFASVATAQRTQDTEQPKSPETNRDASAESDAGQSDRASATQTERSSAQRADGNPQAGQRRTANFRGESAAAGGGNQEVENFLAGCLLANNQAEVELSQLAAQRAEHPQVKEFAQKMVKDHQQLIKMLQPLAGMQADAGRDSRATSGQSERGSATDRSGSAANDSSDPSATASATGAATAGDGAALQQLMQIDRQIVERHTEAARSELEEKQGAKFDKAYVGCVIGAHMHMIAALEVISQHGEGQLSQLAQQAQPKVQEHLDHAKKLMQELEQSGDTAGGNRAARQPSQTQR